MYKIVTSNWSKFGNIEINEAKELLSHVKEIDSYGKVEVMFNTYSGYVFLTDGELKQFYSCPECGFEGFAEDFNDDCESCCIDYAKHCII